MSYAKKKIAQYFCLCRIEDHLGSGQFGMVEKGVWYSPDGPVDVAIKTLKEESSEELTVMFLQEAAIITDNSSILILFDFLVWSPLKNQ